MISTYTVRGISPTACAAIVARWVLTVSKKHDGQIRLYRLYRNSGATVVIGLMPQS